MPARAKKSFCLPASLGKFLSDLEKNNNKEWFDQNRQRYKENFVAPLSELVEKLGSRLAKKVEGLRYEPRINGSLFRLNRDVRFGRDKRPYKTNAGVILWVGQDKKMEAPGFYFHFEPGKMMIGGGFYQFTPAALERFRKKVAVDGGKLAKAIAKAEKKGFALEGEKLKRVPRGFDPDSPMAELLKHKGLFVAKEFPAAKATSGDLVSLLEKEYGAAVDLVKELENLAG